MPQTAQIKLASIVTLHADLDPPQDLDPARSIFDVKRRWLQGAKIKARHIAPAADWLQILRSGMWPLDIRASVVTDDNQPIYITCNGISGRSEQSAAKMASGAPLARDGASVDDGLAVVSRVAYPL